MRGTFPFHDFSGYGKGSRNFSLNLVNSFEVVFYHREGGGKVRRREEFWLETIPDFERGLVGGRVGADIVGKFHKREELRPVVLLVVAKDSKELFNLLVDSFCFSICLRVKGCGEGLYDLEFVPYFFHDMGGKLGASI